MDGMIVDRYLTGISDSEKKGLYDFFCNANAEAAQNRISNISHMVFTDK